MGRFRANRELKRQNERSFGRLRASWALFLALGLCSTALYSARAQAQDAEAGSSSGGVRSAGGDANFRVISRFSGDKKDEEGEDNDALIQVDPSIRQAIAEGRWEVANLLLTGSKEREVSETLPTPKDPYLTLLSGYLALRAQDYALANERLKAVEDKVETLEDYRLFWAAESALKADNPHDAVLFSAEIPSESRLFGAGLMTLARALVQTGEASDIERAITTLKVYLKKYPRGRSAPTARLLLAQTLEEAERWDSAAEIYLEIQEKDPLTPADNTAKTRLKAMRDRLRAALKKRVDEPGVEQRMHRWRALYAQHQSAEAIKELSAALPEFSQKTEADAELRCEALYMLAQSHTKLRQHAESVRWYEQILDDCADTSYMIRALYVGGRGFWNAGQQDEARAWFGRIVEEFPEHSFADDAMYFQARILKEQEKSDEAREMLQAQVERYPDGDMAKDAHWLIVREMFAGENFAEALSYIDALDETGEDDIYSRGRMAYFRGRALEELARAQKPQKDEAASHLKDARAAYREVVRTYPLSYYAYLSINRLALIAGDAPKKDELALRHDPALEDLCELEDGSLCNFIEPSSAEEIVLDDALREAAHINRGQQLLALGLVDLAELEFQALRREHGSAENLWAMTYLLDSAHAYQVSHDLPRRHIEGWQAHYPRGKNDPHWSLAYPHPFSKWVEKYAHQRELSPALIWAIMREESGFNPQIESWANARGLLQLMESTARSVAGRDGLKGFSAEQLFEPEVNIRLGTGYIAELGEQVKAHPALVIAGYNGGFGNVSRWLKERGELPLDLWVEDIPYGQTRDYTKRVLSSYWTYAWLYGRERVPPVSFSLK